MVVGPASSTRIRDGQASGSLTRGNSEPPSTSRVGVALARSANVGATSTLTTGCERVTPAGKPGPRTISGTCEDASYGTVLPAWMRCSPSMNPLSLENTTTVLASSPAVSQRLDDVSDRLVHRPQGLPAAAS